MWWWITLLLVSSALFRPTVLLGTSSSQAMLDSLLVENLQLHLEMHLQSTEQIDSTVVELIEEARQAASRRQWLEARILLELAVELSEDSPSVGTGEEGVNPADSLPGAPFKTNSFPSEPPEDPPITPWRLQAELGFDLSFQSFDLNLLQSDSTVLEQYRVPYAGLLLDHGLGSLATLHHSLRINEQLFRYSASAVRDILKGNWQQRFELEGEYYRSAEFSNLQYLDWRFRYLVGQPSQLFNRWTVELFLRRKTVLSSSADSPYGDVWSGWLRGFFEHRFGFEHALGLELTPEFYQEKLSLGQQYSQIRGELFYRFYQQFNQNLQISAEVEYRDFSSQLNGELYQNSYLALRPRLELEWPLIPEFGIAARIQSEWRKHQNAWEVNPDFRNHQIEGLANIYFGNFKSLGIGLLWEKQVHFAQTEEAQNFVRQADYIAVGPLLAIEHVDFQGKMLNLEYSLSWRNYPSAGTSLFDTFYSDRLVHSLSGFAWIPLTGRWQFQLFANYTDDRDQEKENNNSKNTVLTAGFYYRF